MNYALSQQRLTYTELCERTNTLADLSDRLCNMLTVPVAVECPVGEARCSSDPHNFWALLPHLNDAHMWSREDIADFLDTLDCDLTLTHPDPDRA